MILIFFLFESNFIIVTIKDWQNNKYVIFKLNIFIRLDIFE